jgi:hypothetical protein
MTAITPMDDKSIAAIGVSNGSTIQEPLAIVPAAPIEVLQAAE